MPQKAAGRITAGLRAEGEREDACGDPGGRTTARPAGRVAGVVRVRGAAGRHRCELSGDGLAEDEGTGLTEASNDGGLGHRECLGGQGRAGAGGEAIHGDDVLHADGHAKQRRSRRGSGPPLVDRGDLSVEAFAATVLGEECADGGLNLVGSREERVHARDEGVAVHPAQLGGERREGYRLDEWSAGVRHAGMIASVSAGLWIWGGRQAARCAPVKPSRSMRVASSPLTAGE